jgi:hypothetical protein
MQKEFPFVKAEISKISWEKGSLLVEPRKEKSLPKDGMYIIRDASENIVAIINSESPEIPTDLGGATCYLSSNEIAIEINGTIKKMAYIKNFSVSLDSEIFDIVSGKGTAFFLAGIYPLIFMALFVLLLLLALVFTFPAYGTMRFFGLKMKFYKLFSITIVAMTPAVIVYSMCALLLNRMVLNFVYVSLITILYLYFAFKSIAQGEADEESDSNNKFIK